MLETKMNLYNLVDDVYKSTKVSKSNYSINFCRQADGRLKTSPMFLTTFANFDEIPEKNSRIGLIDFEVCENSNIKNEKIVVCPPVKKEEEEGFFDNTENLIWTIVCGIGLIADIIIIVITIVYYIKTRETKKKDVREIGTETYMALSVDQNPVVSKDKKGQVPLPPPKQLELTTPTVTQTQESVKPQSTVFKTIE
uniref:Allorecognition 2 n=1 Tax=Panagrolaimus davidi TaxID=227884 RepID=A0A914PR48_9BILA